MRLFALALSMAVLAGGLSGICHAVANDSEASAQASAQSSPDCVVLLHGLARSRASMRKLAHALDRAGYHVVNTGYPSRSLPIETLAGYVPQAMQQCPAGGTATVHFVTHSLGGILLRVFFKGRTSAPVGRVVMLAPPNQGSEIVDRLRNVPGFRLYNGPAGQQLGTRDDDLPATLGPTELDTAVIGGTRSYNPLFSQWLPDSDDGKVSLRSTRLDGMCAHLALPVSHTFIMQSDIVIEEVLNYLREGRFRHSDSEELACRARAGGS